MYTSTLILQLGEERIQVPVKIQLPPEYEGWPVVQKEAGVWEVNMEEGLRNQDLLETDQDLVYLMRVERKSVYKIGFSKHPQSRLAEVQTGNHKTVTLEAWCPGGKELETHLHQLMDSRRTREKGEWFRLESQDLNTVRNIMWSKMMEKYPVHQAPHQEDKTQEWGEEEGALEKAIRRGNAREIRRAMRTAGEEDMVEGLRLAMRLDSKLSVGAVAEGMGDIERCLEVAAGIGSRRWVGHFMKVGARGWNGALREAAGGGQGGLVKFFLGQGADDLEGAMKAAIYAGNLGMVKLLAKKKAREWTRYACWAVERKGMVREMYDFFRSQTEIDEVRVATQIVDSWEREDRPGREEGPRMWEIREENFVAGRHGDVVSVWISLARRAREQGKPEMSRSLMGKAVDWVKRDARVRDWGYVMNFCLEMEEEDLAEELVGTWGSRGSLEEVIYGDPWALSEMGRERIIPFLEDKLVDVSLVWRMAGRHLASPIPGVEAEAKRVIRGLKALGREGEAEMVGAFWEATSRLRHSELRRRAGKIFLGEVGISAPE